MFPLSLASLAFVVFVAAAAPTQAACSRPLQLPVASIGASVEIVNGQVGGAYPALLRKLGEAKGCQFHFEPMPRARVEQLFERGAADLLVPATRSDRRDALGEFVPLVQSRVTAIGFNAQRAPVTSLADLLARPQLRVVVVRGFDFGPAYREFVAELRRQGRLVQEQDPAAAVHALQAGLADLTVMASSILFGAIDIDPKLHPLRERLRIEALQDMPWTESGFYLSTRSLSAADRELLRRMLEQARSSGAVWAALQEHYPPGSLDGAVRPIR